MGEIQEVINHICLALCVEHISRHMALCGTRFDRE